MIVLFKKNFYAGLFVLINIFYVTQGLHPALDRLYSLMLLMILAISFVYVYRVNSEFGKSRFIKSLNLLIVLITIYGIANIINPTGVSRALVPDYRPHTYLTNAYCPLLQIYPLYYFSRKRFIDENVIRNWIIPAFIAVFAAYYVNNFMHGFSANIGDVETTSNVGYLVVSLFPLLYFVKKRILKYSLLVIITTLVFFCAKRGAILVAVLSIVWFIYFELKTSTAKNKIWTLILICVVVVFLLRYLTMVFEESYYLNYLLEKTESGDSSGRDVLYEKAWNLFVNSPTILTFLFGHGADSTYGLLGNRAHNDWLEILLNQGALGVIIYVFFWLQIFILWLKSRTHYFLFMVMGSIVIIFFPKTLFSMLYNELSPIACLPFAWCIANIETLTLIKGESILKSR